MANIYFLVMSILMFIGTYQPTVFDSPLSPWSTIGPLLIVLTVTLVKEGVEDWKRHKSDAEVNSRIAQVLSTSGRFEPIEWKRVPVGSIVLVR